MNEWDWIGAVSKVKTAALCTICFTQGSTPREVGAKMLVFPDGKIQGTIGGGHLEAKVITDARDCLTESVSKKISYPLGAKVGQCCGGVVEVFIECILPGPSLYIFGAGHVGQAVCDTFKDTPFRCHLIDDRKEYLFAEGIDDSVVRHHCEWESFVDEAEWNPQRTFAVVMTHEHARDQAIIASLIERPAKYIGLIGSEAKWARFKARYEARGISRDKLARVKCPIGIGNFGKAPKAVAISLAAECLAIHHA